MDNFFTFRPVATFRGLRGIPFVALSHNSLAPELRLSAEGVEIKVLGWRKFGYGDIEQLDYRKSMCHQIGFHLRGSFWRFSCNFVDKVAVLQIIKALQNEGVALSPKALGLLAAQPAEL